jgi:bd-type cytochrome oxidase subunit I
MGMSLAFHIVFACVGVAMPLLMVIAEWLHLKTGDDVYYTLARRWTVGTAIMFAIWGGVGHRAFFRAWPFVATLYEVGWSNYRHAILTGRICISLLRRSFSEFTCMDGTACRPGRISQRVSWLRSAERLPQFRRDCKCMDKYAGLVSGS